MLWLITCVDNPNTAVIRGTVLQPHRRLLSKTWVLRQRSQMKI